MKAYRCYMRAVLLSVLMALVIDTIVNFDQYRDKWAACFGDEEEQPIAYPDPLPAPSDLYKAMIRIEPDASIFLRITRPS